MKEKNNQRINVVSTVLEIIKNKKYHDSINFDSNFITADLKNLYGYYFKESFEAILGRIEFDSDEIEIIATKEGLVIESIFTDPISIHCINTQVGPKIVALMGDEEVFRIDRTSEIITNRIMNGEGKVTVYRADVLENEYTLYQGEASALDIDENELEYIAKLTNYNAKIKEYETFEYTRIKPETEKSNSLIKRILENVINENYVRIPTSNDLVSTSLYADRIFDKIKEIKNREEVKKIKKSQ